MNYNVYMESSDWITQKYIEWRGDAIGREKTITEYAEDYIGVSQEVMYGWMKKDGSKPRKSEHIKKLFDKYGYEVYEVLGFNSVDRRLRELQAEYDAIPEDKKDDMLEVIRRWMREQGWKKEE